MEIKEMIRTKKKLLTSILVIILLVCILFVLMVNQYPGMSVEWSAEFKSVVKQYSKVIGFLSVMGLVYVQLEGKKKETLNEIEEENESE
jgi:uncharacterized membrane protein